MPLTGIFPLFWEKIPFMEEEVTLSAAEVAEYGEFKRARREAEISFTLAKLIIDASRRETDHAALKRACDAAVKLKAAGVLVSPVNVAAAKKLLAGSEISVNCIVGGTGESLISVKKIETKKAVRLGSAGVRLVLCYSRLTGGGINYLKREVKRVRRAVRKGSLIVSLEDHSLKEEDVSLGVRAACAGKANGVCVRGETELVLRAVKEAAGRLTVEVSGVENAEQLRLLLKAGAVRATTGCGEKISEELFAALDGSVRTGEERTDERGGKDEKGEPTA